MKVLWIVPGFSSDERDWCIPALLDLARVMARRCELHIVTLRYPYRRDRYPIYGATVHSIGGGHRGPWFTPSIWRAAQNVIDQLDFDVVHAWWLYEPGWLAARLKQRAPIVISLAGGELINLPSIGYGLARRFYRRWLMRWSLRQADVVTAGSQHLIEIAKKFSTMKRVEFAPLGMDIALFNLAEVELNNRQPSQKPPQGFLLNVGSLEPVKDQATLLQAFQKVHQQLPRTRLVIAGEGNLRGPLSRLVNTLSLTDAVEFRGAVPHEQLPDLYRSASVYAQSSLHESQGMVVLEAAACGVPIVGTRVGVVADLAPYAAVATSVGHVDELAAAMIDVLCDPDRAAEINRVAHSTIERDYTLDRSVDRFFELYRSILIN
jgi:glycosyltransferase involved in cell wall biosynthesis